MNHIIGFAFLTALILPSSVYSQTPARHIHLPGTLVDTVASVAYEYLAAFGDTAGFIRFIDASTEFVDVERGRLKDWKEHVHDIRTFFTSARDFHASWEVPPRIVILNDDAALIVGLARYRFTTSDGKSFDNRQATTMALRRVGRHWRVLHLHGSPAR
jgi:hypothetical protein